jgi:hypothetical protein
LSNILPIISTLTDNKISIEIRNLKKSNSPLKIGKSKLLKNNKGTSFSLNLIPFLFGIKAKREIFLHQDIDD